MGTQLRDEALAEMLQRVVAIVGHIDEEYRETAFTVVLQHLLNEVPSKGTDRSFEQQNGILALLTRRHQLTSFGKWLILKPR